MPDFLIKSGHASNELRDWLKANEGKLIRISVEVESKADRIRRSFHALIREWFNSGEFSANGDKIKTYEALRDYYKLQGCDGVPEWYRFGKYNTKNREEITNYLEPQYHRFIVEDPKSWVDMNKSEKMKALDCLLFEIRHSMTNNQKVLEWVNKIQGEMV